MPKRTHYFILIFFILMLQGLNTSLLYGQKPQELKQDNLETLLPQNAKWLLGVNFGTGFGAYSKTQLTSIMPLHWGMDIGYRSFSIAFEGLLGWPSTKGNVNFGDDQIFSGVSVQMFQGIFALGYIVWLGSQVSIAPHIGYALGSISSENTLSRGRVTEYSRGMLSSSLSISYEFPIERTAMGKASKFPHQSLFIRFLIGYSVTTFEKDGRTFDADLVRIIFSVGSNFRSAP